MQKSEIDGSLRVVGLAIFLAFCSDAEADGTDGGLGDVHQLLYLAVVLTHIKQDEEHLMVARETVIVGLQAIHKLTMVEAIIFDEVTDIDTAPLVNSLACSCNQRLVKRLASVDALEGRRWRR